jgi:hypothetical protein
MNVLILLWFSISKKWFEHCLKQDENPKVLFERLTAVQFKYHNNAQANVTEDDLVAQEVQALPVVFNSRVAGLYETESQLGQAVTTNVLKRAVGYHDVIAMRGKVGPRVIDIEDRFATVGKQVAMNKKDNLKRMIQETINTTIWQFQIKHNAPTANHGKLKDMAEQ